MHTGNGHTDGMRVLIVEDDTQVRTALARALNFEGYEVETAADGAEGLEKVLTGAPDAIVLDVMMPHVDGLEATRRLRARGDATPVLMLTARHEVSDRVAGLDAGADDYLVKPFALEELLARLRALLRRAEPETSEVMRVGDLTLDPATREGTRFVGPFVAIWYLVSMVLFFLWVRDTRRPAVGTDHSIRTPVAFLGRK